jgi:hypothetical protein
VRALLDRGQLSRRRWQDQVSVHAPECVEGAVEGRQVVMAMHQQRATGVKDLVPRREHDVLQRLGDVEQAADMHLQPERPQQPPEDEQVLEQT